MNIESPVIRIAICVDDIRPESGSGMLQDGSMSYLYQLAEELGCQFTLFVPTNWHGSYDILQNEEWTRRLLENPHFEVAAHGHYHRCDNAPSDPREFSNLSTSEADERMRLVINAWDHFGHRAAGFRWPGWGTRADLYPIASRYFQYIADHPVLQQTITHSTTPRLQYHYSIEELDYAGQNPLILHSHIAGPGHSNNWTESNFLQVRRYLKDLGTTMKLEFVQLQDIANHPSYWACQKRTQTPNTQLHTVSLSHQPETSNDSHNLHTVQNKWEQSRRRECESHMNLFSATEIRQREIAMEDWSRISQEIPKHSKILDIGCGGMWFCSQLAADGWENVTGMSVDARDLKKIRANNRILSTINADACNIPVNDCVYDLVWSRQTFEHLISPWMGICEAFRILKPCGKFCLIVPTHETTLIYGESHLFVMPMKNWDNLLHKAKFHIVIEDIVFREGIHSEYIFYCEKPDM